MFLYIFGAAWVLRTLAANRIADFFASKCVQHTPDFEHLSLSQDVSRLQVEADEVTRGHILLVVKEEDREVGRQLGFFLALGLQHAAKFQSFE